MCTPAADADERACAERIAATLARRAFRRPASADDVARLMPFYDAGRKAGAFDAGVEQLVTAVLASPDFLYRAIAAPATASALGATASDRAGGPAASADAGGANGRQRAAGARAAAERRSRPSA